MLQVEFDETEVFTRVSSFYREKDNKFQPKRLTFIVRCKNPNKDEKISEVSLNISPYIGKGVVKDSLQLTGNAYFVDFEISVTPAEGPKSPTTNVKASTASHE